MNWSLNGSSSTSPLTAKRWTGPGAPRAGRVGVHQLGVDPSGGEVVAEDPRRAAGGEARRGAVLRERPLHPDEEVAAVRRHRRGLEGEVLPHAVRRARRQECVGDGQVAEERPAERVAAYERRDADVRDALRRDDQLPALCEPGPSGSRLAGAYGCPFGASSVVTARNETSPLSRRPSERSTVSV